MDDRLDNYRTNFLERLVVVETEMDAMKAELAKQTNILNELLKLTIAADRERQTLIASVDQIKPTINTIRDTLVFASVGRKFLVAMGAAVAAITAILAGAFGGWHWLIQTLGNGK